jgi:predicted glycoside hydrolase/deacetylase ChbG (UPF0249 family)
VIDADDAGAVRAELTRQFEEFVTLLGRQPTHLDSHQHVHQSEPARSILLDAARRLAVPLRSCSAAIRYDGNFYGQTGEGDPFPDGISLRRLHQMIEALPAGWTEFGCHVGYADGLDSVYSAGTRRRTACSLPSRAAGILGGEWRDAAVVPRLQRLAGRRLVTRLSQPAFS